MPKGLRPGASDGNQTRVTCLEGRGSIIELHPHIKGEVGRPWNGGGRPTHQWEMYRYGGGDPVAWHRCKDLNPGHTVLETAALPTELHPYIALDVLAPPHPGDCPATERNRRYMEMKKTCVVRVGRFKLPAP